MKEDFKLFIQKKLLKKKRVKLMIKLYLNQKNIKKYKKNKDIKN
jgi:hypothetical protein